MRRIILSILFLFLTNSLYAQAVNTNYLCKADIALTNAQIIALPTTPITVAAAPGSVSFTSLSFFGDADVVNQPLRILIDNAMAGVLTGGNAGNAITGSTLFFQMDVTTGTFEACP